VAHRGEAVLISDVAADGAWIARPEWAAAEGIASFAAQPVAAAGETLGVVGVFSRSPLAEREQGWLRTFADHAATSIRDARAFDEIVALRGRLEAERDALRDEAAEVRGGGGMLGASPSLGLLLERIEQVATTDTTVLLQGESGTGKELAALAIHERSGRRDQPLVRVNCASIAPTLFESEFFGHVRGAFTGARQDRVGRFELAHGGTLFLDEVGEIPLELQGKLLRVLQEGTLERVGEARTRTVDVRLIAATNRDLRAEVAAGRFREDLFYRLEVFPLTVPPLRDRRDDVPVLAQHFLDRATDRMGRPRMVLNEGELAALQAQDWPGNVRELRNAIERGVILARGGRIGLEGPGGPPRGGAPSPPPPAGFVTEERFRLQERDNVVAALRHANGTVAGPDGAAALLGLKPSTLTSRMRRMGIQRGEYS